MTKVKKIAAILGARPNFVKAAPIFARLKEYPDLHMDVLHTGQHYDENMSHIFFEQMNIPKPKVNLEFGGSNQISLGEVIASLTKIYKEEQYSDIIVFGDTDSTLAGAIAAKEAGCNLFHVESGLRSYDKRMPEEKNRVVIDHLSDVLFTTELAGREHLIEEGVSIDKIKEVGNIMIESIELYGHLADRSDILERLNIVPGQYVVNTIHRIENTSDDKIFSSILETLQQLGTTHTIVFPLHPGTKNRIKELGFESLLETLIVIEPQGYLDFMKLVRNAKAVITDSGGIQEETSHLGIPCATLRDNTERPITLTKGSNMLFPLNSLNVSDVEKHINKDYFQAKIIPLWDDLVSKRILDVISTH